MTAVPARSRALRSSPGLSRLWWAVHSDPGTHGRTGCSFDARDEVNALAWALPGGIDHLEAEPFGHVRATTRVGHELAVGVLDVRQPVDVELEHLGRVLHTQPVTGAPVLVDPDPLRLAGHHPPPFTNRQGTASSASRRRSGDAGGESG